MLPFNIQLWALRPTGSLLRAGFATSKPRPRALPPASRGSVRRPSPQTPIPRHNRASKPPNNERIQRRQKALEAQGAAPESPESKQSSVDTVSAALREQDPQINKLLSPVHIPENSDGVLNGSHPATSILSHSSIVVTRQLELMNVMLGFEQANKYVIMDP